MDHSSRASTQSSSWMNPSNWWNSRASSSSSQQVASKNTSSFSGGCPVKHDDTATSRTGGCPVKHTAQEAKALPPSLEEAAKHAQTPHPEQRIPLSTQRIVSTIPRADEQVEEVPHHQPQHDKQWVYPSEQQFYNAMRRKGWQGVDESTIPAVVRIHNAVNERGWSEVRRWERDLHGCENPRLVRFLGRPNDLSPKAWFNSKIMLYNPPFDRHDWYVDRGDDQEPRRYVIDFYNGNDGTASDSWLTTLLRERLSSDPPPQSPLPPPPSLPTRPPAMYLDVRPALDSPEALADRARMFVRDAFPGLFAALGSSRSTPPAKGNSSLHPPPPSQNES